MKALHGRRANAGKHSMFLVGAILLYLPLAFNVIEFKGKQVDIAASDIIILFLLLIYGYMYWQKKVSSRDARYLLLPVVAIVAFLLLALFGYGESGRLMPILSAIKFEKVFLALIAGMCFSRFCDFNAFWRTSSIASLLIVLSLHISELLINSSFSIRWGATVFGYPVYGFPNSSASYYILFVMLAVIACLRGLNRYMYAGLAFLSAVFMVMSYSRSALVILIFFLLLILFYFPVKKIIKGLNAMLPAVLIFCVTLLASSSQSVINDSKPASFDFESRANQTFYSNKPFGGRIEIALETISLVEKKPLFGYKFEPFSNYNSVFDTPHNQYLEILFKSGIFGFLLYFGVLVFFLFIVIKKAYSPSVSLVDRRSVICFLLAFLSLMLGNLAQPNFTFTQTGNVSFFILGFLLMTDMTKLNSVTNKLD